MGRKPNKTGRCHTEHFFKMERRFLENPSWRALSSAGQSVYLFIRLEWRGPHANNNGKIRLSVRQAAEKTGLGLNTAARAFHDLQAKGFIHVVELGALGCSGEARGPSYEITELPMPNGNMPTGRRLFERWRKGNDFPVQKHNVNNPTGANGKKLPSSKQGRTCHQTGNERPIIVTNMMTPRH